MIRLYINLTNKCNSDCPFCCMYSGKEKNTFMDFNVFKYIIDGKDDDFELQLEGGEPLLHPFMLLFMWYAHSTGRCKKIIILTNGKLLSDYLEEVITFMSQTEIPIEIKMSLNYWLYKENPHIFKQARDLYCSTEFVDGISVIFNVRMRHGDEWIIDLLKENKIYKQSNVFYLQSYGRMTGTDYEKPVIVQNVDDWFIYSCDGKCFDKDLIARSEHEKGLV